MEHGKENLGQEVKKKDSVVKALQFNIGSWYHLAEAF